MSIRATVRDVERVGDEGARLQFVTLAVGDAVFGVRDTRELIDPAWVGTERDVVAMAFFPEVSPVEASGAGVGEGEQAGDAAAGAAAAGAGAPGRERPAGIEVLADRVAFSGRVTAVRAGEEGFVGTLDVGDGTVRFDPGTAPEVRPGDVVTVRSGTVHVVAVEE